MTPRQYIDRALNGGETLTLAEMNKEIQHAIEEGPYTLVFIGEAPQRFEETDDLLAALALRYPHASIEDQDGGKDMLRIWASEADQKHDASREGEDGAHIVGVIKL
jgi:hypothetical protein